MQETNIKHTVLTNRPRYQAPEENCDRDWNQEIDVWHVGIVLFEMAVLETAKDFHPGKTQNLYD